MDTFEAGVLAELLYAHHLVLKFIELFTDRLQYSNALAITLSGNALYVLRVDTQPFGFHSHTLSIALSRL